METIFSEERYEEMIEKLFVRFPSFQKSGSSAYKPGIANMEFFDQLAGHPHRNYKIIHVAGTNGKGSVSNMLASVLAAQGFKVGLYTSPHILDFRERMRVISEEGGQLSRLVSKEYIWDFVNSWQDTFDHLDMSFFEITTSIALSWFAHEEADFVVLETGLGGRLDSTNIVTPVLSVITNIGLDHCDLLGNTLPEIAFEKAGIIKPKVPVVIGESHPETDPVFERKVLYTNLPESEFMGSRTAIMSLLIFADKIEPEHWDRHDEILAEMDLQGSYQHKNLRTVLAVLGVLQHHTLSATQAPSHCVGPDRSCCRRLFAAKVRWTVCPVAHDPYPGVRKCLFHQTGYDFIEALVNTAKRTDFHGRWEKLSDNPYMICDIGHNEHGLRHNFAQLSKMIAEGERSKLIIVYGSVADKDVDSVIHLFPEDAVYVFTQADSHRALPAEKIEAKYLAHCSESGRQPCPFHCVPRVADAVALAYTLAGKEDNPIIYIGGSTYVVSEACAGLK